MDNPSRFRRILDALKPATTRALIVRLIIAALAAAGVTWSIDPSIANAGLALLLTLAEAVI